MKTAILVAISLSVVSANAIERLLVPLAGNTRTSTFMKIETTVLPLTVPVTCAVHVGVAGNCRRRRGVEEQPIIVEADEGVDVSKVLSPNQPLKVETTAIPEFEPVALDTPQEEINSVLDASFDTEAGQRNGKLFGVSVVYKTTSTFKATSYTTVHSGLKSFVVSVCTPEGFPYPKC